MTKGDMATTMTTMTKDRPGKDNRDNTNDMCHHVTDINDCHYHCQWLLSMTAMMVVHATWWKWGSRMTSRQETGQHEIVKAAEMAPPFQHPVCISCLLPQPACLLTTTSRSTCNDNKRREPQQQQQHTPHHLHHPLPLPPPLTLSHHLPSSTTIMSPPTSSTTTL